MTDNPPSRKISRSKLSTEKRENAARGRWTAFSALDITRPLMQIKNPSVEQRRRMGQVMPHRANSTDGRRSKQHSIRNQYSCQYLLHKIIHNPGQNSRKKPKNIPYPLKNNRVEEIPKKPFFVESYAGFTTAFGDKKEIGRASCRERV